MCDTTHSRYDSLTFSDRVLPNPRASSRDTSVVLCVAVWCCVVQCGAVCRSVLQCVEVYSSVLQYVAVCCSLLPCVAVCCSVLQCVAVCCSVLQCVAMCSVGPVTPVWYPSSQLPATHCNALQHTATHGSILITFSVSK